MSSKQVSEITSSNTPSTLKKEADNSSKTSEFETAVDNNNNNTESNITVKTETYESSNPEVNKSDISETNLFDNAKNYAEFTVTKGVNESPVVTISRIISNNAVVNDDALSSLIPTAGGKRKSQKKPRRKFRRGGGKSLRHRRKPKTL